MFANRWFRRPWFTSRTPIRTGGGKSCLQSNPVRPSLEALEDRMSPAIGFPTITSIIAGLPQFSLFSQTETVTTQTNFTDNTGVTLGVNGTQGTGTFFSAPPPAVHTVNTQPQTVTITDGGQTQTVNVSATGQATATFRFNLLQELQQRTFSSHPITASYSGAPAGGGDQLWGASTVSGNAPGNTTGFFFQLFIDYYIYTNVVAPQLAGNP